MIKKTKPEQEPTSPAHPKGEPPPLSIPDLFLDEGMLVALAMRELKGATPDGMQYQGTSPIEGKPNGLPTSSQFRTLLARELDARGWTARDLAKTSGLSPSESLALAKGNQKMTQELAKILARVFATSEEFWFNPGE